MANKLNRKSKIIPLLSIVLVVSVFNTPVAGRLGNRTSLFLNGVVIAVFVAWGSYKARVADETQIPFVLAGFVRTRRLLFIAYGGYFLGATVGVFGARC